jgi:hypothetical protein
MSKFDDRGIERKTSGSRHPKRKPPPRPGTGRGVPAPALRPGMKGKVTGRT